MGTCLPSCDNFNYMMLNLVGEVGELAGKVAKAIRKEEIGMYSNNLHVRLYGPPKFQSIEHDLMCEAGDILWQLSGLCKVMGWSLEEVALGNLDKLAARKAEGTIISHTDH